MCVSVCSVELIKTIFNLKNYMCLHLSLLDRRAGFTATIFQSISFNSVTRKSFWLYFSKIFFTEVSFFWNFSKIMTPIFSTVWLMPWLLLSWSLCVAKAQRRLQLYSEMPRPFLALMATLEVLTFRFGALPLSHRLETSPLGSGVPLSDPLVLHCGTFAERSGLATVDWQGGTKTKLRFSLLGAQ